MDQLLSILMTEEVSYKFILNRPENFFHSFPLWNSFSILISLLTVFLGLNRSLLNVLLQVAGSSFRRAETIFFTIPRSIQGSANSQVGLGKGNNSNSILSLSTLVGKCTSRIGISYNNIKRNTKLYKVN